MEKTIRFQGKKIAYQISGNGPAMILLHGFLESKAIWNDFTDVLQSKFLVIAVDLPGHGQSESLSEIHTMKQMAEAVKAVLLAENIEHAVIAGHSMGGYVALQFATEYENILKGLVLFHSHAGADSAEAKENRRRTIDIVMQNKTGFIRQFIPDLFDKQHQAEYSRPITKLQNIAALMSPEAIVAALAGMRDRESRLPCLSTLAIPVLFIAGKNDSRISFELILSQAVMPSHSELMLLDNVGHMGFIEAFRKTSQALLHFASRCSD